MSLRATVCSFARAINLSSVASRTAVLSPFKFFSVSSNARYFSSSAAVAASNSKLLAILRSEYEQEKAAQAQVPPKLEKFLNSSDWKCETKVGDVNVTLSRNVGGKRVSVDFQLVNPNLNGEEGEEEAMGDGEENEGETTDFSVTIENAVENQDADKSAAKPNAGGVTFYCTTVAGDKFRYLIGNVRLFKNEEEKNSVSSYNGPEFEGLSPSLQENLENYLDTFGINNDLCDIIDEMAIDKETKEYANWLESFMEFLKK